MTLLRGHFAMTLICAGDRRRTPTIEAALAPLTADGTLTVTVREVPRGGRRRPAVRRGCSPCTAATGPASSPRSSREVARVGGNITDLTTRLAGDLYLLIAEIDLPAGADAERRSRPRSRRSPPRSASGRPCARRRPTTCERPIATASPPGRRPSSASRAGSSTSSAPRRRCCPRRRPRRPDRRRRPCSSPPTWSPRCGSAPAASGLAAPQVGVGARVFCVDVSAHPKTRTTTARSCCATLRSWRPAATRRRARAA